MTAARGRKRTKSVNGNRDEGLISLGSREFGNRNSRTRFVLLAMTTRLNEIDDVRLKSIPRMSIGAEKLQGGIDAMVSHYMVVVVSENDELIWRDRKGRRSEESCFLASWANGDEVVDVRKEGWPIKIVSLHHAVHVRSREVAKRVIMIATECREMICRRLCDRGEGQSRDCREMGHGRRWVMIARVESTVVDIRVVRRRKRLDDEVRGSAGRERPRENVRDEVVGSQDDREIEGVLLEEKVPANDFGGLGMADEHEIPMIGVHNEVRSFEKVVQLGDGVDNGEAFQFLNLPTSLHVRQALGDELDGSKLGVNNLEENRANARSGGDRWCGHSPNRNS